MGQLWFMYNLLLDFFFETDCLVERSIKQYIFKGESRFSLHVKIIARDN